MGLLTDVTFPLTSWEQNGIGIFGAVGRTPLRTIMWLFESRNSVVLFISFWLNFLAVPFVAFYSSKHVTCSNFGSNIVTSLPSIQWSEKNSVIRKEETLFEQLVLNSDYWSSRTTFFQTKRYILSISTCIGRQSAIDPDTQSVTTSKYTIMYRNKWNRANESQTLSD